MVREIHAELLLGRQVFAKDGEAIGRIEEIIAEPKGNLLVVLEYHLGSYALMERLSASPFGRALLEFFGAGRIGQGYRVPWHRLDLSDPEKPKLLCAIDQLEKLDRP
jgi:sporulation protein YlmC with PRC-barrel domain